MWKRRAPRRGFSRVLTGSEAVADGIRPIPHSPVPTNPHEVPLKSPDGSPFFIAPHPVLAIGTARYVGEPVAVVVAETAAQAMDAAERIEVRVRTAARLRPVGRCAGAGRPAIWPQHDSNLCVTTEAGDGRRRQRRSRAPLMSCGSKPQ